MKKRILLAVGFLAVAFAGLWFWAGTDLPPGPQGEVVAPGEDAMIARMIPQAITIVDSSRQVMMKDSKQSQPFRRFAHAKTHACVQARFQVLDAAQTFRFGLFAKPAEYQSWIRFSNGSGTVQNDSKADARGMAIKIMGVAGEKLLESEKDAATQDFVMMNAARFFTNGLPDYALFMEALAKGEPHLLPFFLNPLEWRLRELRLFLSLFQAPPDSVLNARFYSASAYKLGPQLNVKYSARPCQTRPAPAVDRSQPGFLRQELVQGLAQAPACFEFMVQPQVAGKNMPVEDLRVEWKESDSAFVPVARVEIPKQDLGGEAQDTFCENLSFTPWHTLPEHRPIGGLNRARKELYLAISRYRRGKNGAPVAEPQGWCLKLGTPCDDAAAASR